MSERCGTCGIAWAHHPGITATCAELCARDSRIAELEARLAGAEAKYRLFEERSIHLDEIVTWLFRNVIEIPPRPDNLRIYDAVKRHDRRADALRDQADDAVRLAHGEEA